MTTEAGAAPVCPTCGESTHDILTVAITHRGVRHVTKICRRCASRIERAGELRIEAVADEE